MSERISFTTDESMKSSLDKASKETGLSVSLIIRKCIEFSLDEVKDLFTSKATKPELEEISQ